jgi:hypothetical protein
MQLPQHSFDSDTVDMMGRACDEAWALLQAQMCFPAHTNQTEVRHLLALRIMAAVVEGERNPERLKAIALTALDA